MSHPAMNRHFVPLDFDPADFSHIQPLLDQLKQRSLSTAEDLKHWLADVSELSAVVGEYGSRKNIDSACHTDDPAIEAAYMHFIENIRPRLQPEFFELQKKYVQCQWRTSLTDPKFEILGREWSTDVQLFRDENVPLQTQTSKLTNEYNKLCGSMMVDFQGQTFTLQQMARFTEDPDRATREAAWRLVSDRRLADRDAIDRIFEKQLDLRAQTASNAGFDNYRQYTWKSRYRFDYQPEDCLAFGDAVEKICVPLVDELDRKRRQDLAVDSLRPWDISVDVKGRPGLRPFEQNDIQDFVTRTRLVFDRISPQLGQLFSQLKMGTHLDLDSRKGKRPGGFQASLEEARQPFIFMNAAGMQRDVETLLHEGGHAFHYIDSRDEPLVFLRHAPLEFCEVASMSMELLAADHMDIFYTNPDDARRAKKEQLEGVIRILPWIATIDGFQHWLYTHPGHSRQQRTDAWLDILSRFGSSIVDWTDLQTARQSMWHRQIHLFAYPFYYIEYGIAQLGALGVWLNFRRDPDQALRQLRDAFALAGTRPLPELFQTAGINFDFSHKTVAPLIRTLAEDLRNVDD